MSPRSRQFSIASLMIVIAIIGVFLAYPLLFFVMLGLLVHLCFLLVIPFVFLFALAMPLILLNWLESADDWFKDRKLRKNSSGDLAKNSIPGESIPRSRPIESSA